MLLPAADNLQSFLDVFQVLLLFRLLFQFAHRASFSRAKLKTRAKPTLSKQQLDTMASCSGLVAVVTGCLLLFFLLFLLLLMAIASSARKVARGRPAEHSVQSERLFFKNQGLD